MFRFVGERGESRRNAGVCFYLVGVLKNRNRHLNRYLNRHLVEAGKAESLENIGAGEGNRTVH